MILVNEFNKSTTFYKFYGAEENMRQSALTNPNAYAVGIFACCREIFLLTQHSKCISLADKSELELKQRVEDQRRLQNLMKIVSEYFATIVNTKW